jgi:hypothetical protein
VLDNAAACVVPNIDAGGQSAILASNANELTYSFNAGRWGQWSARKSHIFARAISSARSLSVETVCAVSRTFRASRR